ncbi:unnamed protein product [Candidula unifasciata]|uniref:Cation-dependent mannose-6-phosphate receptor n=1 Tax=Candidula unifasciata TaxID=100452 RepID=A0A8S3ZSE9_9EUPU|nr:unnamed protein product [Candidula unifasciata]
MISQYITGTKALIIQLLLLSRMELCVWGETQTCQGDGPCRCVMSDGGVVDISSIGNTDGTARFPESPSYDADLFSYNPCFPSGVQGCNNAAVCQSVNTSFVNIGSQDSAQWTFRVHYPIVTYTSVDKKIEVMLICDMNFTNPQLTVIGQLPNGTIGMMLTSRCACPEGCKGVEPTGTSSRALSAGYVTIIVFFAVIGVYLILGTSINCARYGKTGSEAIPNYSFWSAYFSLVQEGFRFTKHAVCCTKDESYQSI